MAREPSSAGWTVGLALLGAALLGGSRGGLGALVAPALLGALLAQVFFLRRRANALQRELSELREALHEARLPAATAAVSAGAAVPAATATPAAAHPTAPAPAAAQRTAPPIAWDAARTATPAAGSPPATQHDAPVYPTYSAPAAHPAPRAEPTPLEAALVQFWAWLRRGNPLAQAGLVVLFFGASFLAKYAADHSLLPLELRLAALAAGACALTLIGWRLRERQGLYAQLLQGGGIAGLYLTVFSATKLYGLLPLGLALALLVAIALAGTVLAVAQNALPLALIGTSGGFLAPVLVSSGGGSHIALFSYYAVLNLGVLAAAWFKGWHPLAAIGFAFTFGITGLWRFGGYSRDALLSSDLFLVLFFLMYVAIAILNALRQAGGPRGYVSGSLVFGLPVVAFSLHASLLSHIEYALAWSTLALGAFYLALGWGLLRSGRESLRLLVEAFAALGVIFASLAIPLAFDTRTTASMWAVEGAGLVWLGVRQQRGHARLFGVLLQLCAALGYLATVGDLARPRPLLNSGFAGALLLAGSALFTGEFLQRGKAHATQREAGLHLAFIVWGLAWWFFAGLSEIERFAHPQRLGAALAFTGATAVLLDALSQRRRWELPEGLALSLPVAGALIGLFAAAPLGHPFAAAGAAGWLPLLAAHFALLRRGERGEPSRADRGNSAGRALLHAGSCWLLALLTAWEASWQIRALTAGVWSSLPWGLAPALGVAWLGRRTLLPAWPLARHADRYRVLGAAPLALFAALWIAGINLSSSGATEWLPYLPLLNPLDLSVALCLAAGGLWWTSLAPAQRAALGSDDPRALAAGVALLVFLWLSAALVRALHHGLGAPITLPEMVNSGLVQSALSIFWGLLGFGAMTLAARRRWRWVWLAAAGLMALVVAKLFLFDLANVGTLARIASFLSVGALLLVTGYVAPLPPADELARVET